MDDWRREGRGEGERNERRKKMIEVTEGQEGNGKNKRSSDRHTKSPSDSTHFFVYGVQI